MENSEEPVVVEYWMYKREKELRAKAEHKLNEVIEYLNMLKSEKFECGECGSAERYSIVKMLSNIINIYP